MYSKKKSFWAPCKQCQWEPELGVHSKLQLCAPCFEENLDEGHVRDRDSYGACRAEGCRAKTEEQRVLRDKSCQRSPGQSSGGYLSKDPPTMILWQASSCAAPPPPAAPPFRKPPPPPVHHPDDVQELHAEVKHLKGDMKEVLRMTEYMVGIFEVLRLALQKSSSSQTGWQ
jgi:hypothetical protein